VGGEKKKGTKSEVNPNSFQNRERKGRKDCVAPISTPVWKKKHRKARAAENGWRRRQGSRASSRPQDRARGGEEKSRDSLPSDVQKEKGKAARRERKGKRKEEPGSSFPSLNRKKVTVLAQPLRLASIKGEKKNGRGEGGKRGGKNVTRPFAYLILSEKRGGGGGKGRWFFEHDEREKKGDGGGSSRAGEKKKKRKKKKKKKKEPEKKKREDSPHNVIMKSRKGNRAPSQRREKKKGEGKRGLFVSYSYHGKGNRKDQHPAHLTAHLGPGAKNEDDREEKKKGVREGQKTSSPNAGKKKKEKPEGCRACFCRGP